MSLKSINVNNTLVARVDSEPTAGSENLVKSYGVNSLIQKESGATFEIGSINVDTGEEVSNSKHLRSSLIFPDNNGNISLHCDYPLYLLALLLYSNSGTYESKIFAGASYTDFSYNSNGKPVRAIFERRDFGNIQEVDENSIILIAYNSIRNNINKLLKKEVNDISYITINEKGISYEIGSLDITNGQKTPSDYALRSDLIIKDDKNSNLNISTNKVLYIRALLEYDFDGSFIQTLFGGEDRTECTYSGNKALKVVFTKRDSSKPNISDISDIKYVNRKLGILEFVSPVKNKTLIVLGDSIPHGQVVDGDVPTSPYPNIVADSLGMILKNYAIGGSTIAQSNNYGGAFDSYEAFVAAEKDTSKLYDVLTGYQTYNSYKYENGNWVVTGDSTSTPISARYQYMDDGDVILIHCGTNDFQYNWTDVGTMADRTPNTFYGALHYTILGLLQKYLTKSIIFCTPIKRAQSPYTNQTSANAKGKTLSDYADMIKEVCKYYSIPVINLYSESLLNSEIASQASLFDSYKTHPLQAGHNMLARVVAGKINSFYGTNT